MLTAGELYLRLQKSGWKVDGSDDGLYFFIRRRWPITMDSDGNLYAGRGNDGVKIKQEDALK